MFWCGRIHRPSMYREELNFAKRLFFLLNFKNRLSQFRLATPALYQIVTHCPSQNVHSRKWCSIRQCPVIHLRVPALTCQPTRPLVPRAAVCVQPLQHLEVSTRRRRCARPLVPRASVLAQPLQHLEVPAPRR